MFFSLANQPVLIGALWPDREKARTCRRGDIDLAFCEGCGHVWNVSFDAGRVDYDQTYDNSLHYSPTFQRYTEALVDRLVSGYGLTGKRIVDIGGGKGDFLAMLCEAGDNWGYGFDPTYEGERTSTPAAERITWHRDYYDERHAAVQADLITSRFVFEHIPEPMAFLGMIRRSIKEPERTVVYFEVPHIDLIIRQFSVWDVIYEHVGYFSPESLSAAFAGAGFEVLAVHETYNDQFLAIEARVADNAHSGSRHGSVAALERDIGAFRDRVAQRMADWRDKLAAWERADTKVVAWGAGAKAVGFLNMMQIDERIPAVVDINPHKRGKHLAGTGQKIVSPEDLTAAPPDVVVMMNPVYRDEIAATLERLGLRPELVDA